MARAAQRIEKLADGLSGTEMRALSMFDFGVIGQALSLTSWDVSHEIERLVSIAKEGKPAESIAAMKSIRLIVRDSAELNGHITAERATMKGKAPDGTRITATKSASRLVAAVRAQAPEIGRPVGGASPGIAQLHLPPG